MHVIVLGKAGRNRLAVPGAEPWYANPTDPALTVMTDFRERSAVTVSENAKIDHALEHMKHTGVRCAFATDDDHYGLTGIITAYDITGEIPMRHMGAATLSRGDVLVRDIMQRVGDWRVADIREIEASTVASVADLFDRVSVTHVPVLEFTGGQEPRLRGVLSAANVRRLLSRHRAVSDYRNAGAVR